MNEEDVWMFFSLDQPVTKNQLLNTKCQARFFVVITIWKEERQPGLFYFQNANTTQTLADIWCLVFGYYSSADPMKRTEDTYIMKISGWLWNNLKWYKNHSFLQLEKTTSQKGHIVIHEPLLLDRTVCLPPYSMWPSFGYFSTVILVNFSCANSTTSANFMPFFVHGISFTPTDLSLLKGFSKISKPFL